MLKTFNTPIGSECRCVRCTDLYVKPETVWGKDYWRVEEQSTMGAYMSAKSTAIENRGGQWVALRKAYNELEGGPRPRSEKISELWRLYRRHLTDYRRRTGEHEAFLDRELEVLETQRRLSKISREITRLNLEIAEKKSRKENTGTLEAQVQKLDEWTLRIDSNAETPADKKVALALPDIPPAPITHLGHFYCGKITAALETLSQPEYKSNFRSGQQSRKQYGGLIKQVNDAIDEAEKHLDPKDRLPPESRRRMIEAAASNEAINNMLSYSAVQEALEKNGAKPFILLSYMWDPPRQVFTDVPVNAIIRHPDVRREENIQTLITFADGSQKKVPYGTTVHTSDGQPLSPNNVLERLLLWDNNLHGPGMGGFWPVPTDKRDEYTPHAIAADPEKRARFEVTKPINHEEYIQNNMADIRNRAAMMMPRKEVISFVNAVNDSGVYLNASQIVMNSYNFFKFLPLWASIPLTALMVGGTALLRIVNLKAQNIGFRPDENTRLGRAMAKFIYWKPVRKLIEGPVTGKILKGPANRWAAVGYSAAAALAAVVGLTQGFTILTCALALAPAMGALGGTLKNYAEHRYRNPANEAEIRAKQRLMYASDLMLSSIQGVFAVIAGLGPLWVAGIAIGNVTTSALSSENRPSWLKFGSVSENGFLGHLRQRWPGLAPMLKVAALPAYAKTLVTGIIGGGAIGLLIKTDPARAISLAFSRFLSIAYTVRGRYEDDERHASDHAAVNGTSGDYRAAISSSGNGPTPSLQPALDPRNVPAKRVLILANPLVGEQEQGRTTTKTYVNAVMDIGGIGSVDIMRPCEGGFTINGKRINGVSIDDIVSHYDGFVLTGSPSNPRPIEGGPVFDVKNDSDPEMDKLARRLDKLAYDLIKSVDKQDKPGLYICGGAQRYNVAMGGTLKPVNEDVHGSQTGYDALSDYDQAHKLSIVPGSWLDYRLGTCAPPASSVGSEIYPNALGAAAAICQREDLSVNSVHNYGIDLLGRGLVADAVAPDGLVEIFHHKNRLFSVAVQSHPERQVHGDRFAAMLFQDFGRAVKGELVINDKFLDQTRPREPLVA